MKKTTWNSNYFCGNEISEYGKEHGYVDYATLAKSFDCVLNNEIMQKTQDIGCWELDNGIEYYYEDNEGNTYDEESKEERIDELKEQLDELEEGSDEYSELEQQIDELERMEEIYYDVYQYYIISDAGASILRDYTDEIVWYNEELDMYVWGVTHYGTSWNYVLTDIKIEKKGE